jgi:DnaJ-class molecular chaperone
MAKTPQEPCDLCHGMGILESEIHHGPGWTICVDRATEQCPRCGGNGRKAGEEGEKIQEKAPLCSTCGGQGSLPITDRRFKRKPPSGQLYLDVSGMTFWACQDCDGTGEAR